MTLSLLFAKLLTLLGLSFTLSAPQSACVVTGETAQRSFAPPPTCAVEAPVEDDKKEAPPSEGSARSIAPSNGDASADDSGDGISNGI